MTMTGRMVMAGVVVAAALGVWDQRVAGGPPLKGIELKPLGAYTALDDDGKVFFDKAAIEISAFDPVTARAFVTFGEAPRVDIVDLSDPSKPVLFDSIDLTPWGEDAHSTSVAVRDGVVAVAIPQGEDDTDPGRVTFFDTDGVLITEVTVGALPDMLTFTPDGDYLLTANEGQPLDDYSYDPEGSVSLIDLRGGVASLTADDVTEIGFTDFNGTTLDPSIRIFGPSASVAEDLEPEYIAVSHDSKTAWVTLQENNAIATIDLKARRVTALMGLGFKDHSIAGQGIDASKDSTALVKTWPVLGMYMPDAIATLKMGTQTFLVTANEGDVREYDGINSAGNEAVDVEDIALDATAFPDAATLQVNAGIGKLKVTRFNGDEGNDGDYEALYAFGARSFSIWSPQGVWCSTAATTSRRSPKPLTPLSSTPAARTTPSTTAATTRDRSRKASPWRRCSDAPTFS